MEYILVIVVLGVLFYFLVMKKHGNLDFWKMATKYPNAAYQMFKEEDCWLVFQNKSLARNRSNFPPGEWDGPFKLFVPILGLRMITVYGKVPDYVQSQQGFMIKQSRAITSSEVIRLLVTQVANFDASGLVNECKKIGMRQVPYQDVGQDLVLPPFDIGYNLCFNLEGKGEASLEILQKDAFVLQAGYQFVLSKGQGSYQQIKQILESHYGVGYPTEIGEIKIINYANHQTIAYLSRIRIAGSDALTIRVGNKRFYN